MQPLIRELRSLLGPKGWLEGSDVLPYSRDWLDEYGNAPLGVARPCSTQETAAVVRACAAGRAIVVPQGGNTGLCGGSVGVTGPAVIVSLSRLDGISRVDTIGNTLEVEAGAVLQRVHEVASEAQMMFPLRLGSEGSARIGGLIATNAGGSHALRYGAMQDLVLGLEVVLADGTVWDGMRPVIKDNAGYQLRRLFCGSEGTLGIVTRALLRLFPAPRHSITALVAVPGIDAALRFAALLRSHADEFLSGLEFFNDIGLDLALRHVPGLDFPLETRTPCYLLVELTSSVATAPLESLWEQVLAEAMEKGWILDGAIAGSERQRRHFWRLREEQPEGQRLEGSQIKNDISVPVARLDLFLREAGNAVGAILPGVRVNAFGHLGDGNVHYNLSPVEKGGDFAGRDDELRLAVARVAQNLGGSFAAEHGLGRSKVFLADCLRGRPERMLMQAIKHAFDPTGTLNPGVLVRAAPRSGNDNDRTHGPAGPGDITETDMQRNGGHLLVECLVNLGATRGFGVPGESYLAVLDGLHDVQDRFEFVMCRNEGGASFMAAAYGKLTGTPGLCFVTRGPGATNASIGVHTAKQDSCPCILFVGQVGLGMKEREAFQEIDYRAMFGTVAKWVTEIEAADRIPEILQRAWTTATSGRPGPVVIALPEDMLRQQTSAPALTAPARVEEPAPSAQVMKDVRTMLGAAKRPLVLFGGCDWSDAGREALQGFAVASDMPVVATFRYQDRFDNHLPVYAGDAGVGMQPATKELIRNADVLLAINTRFGENTTDGYGLLNVPVPAQKLIHVHSSAMEIGKVYQPQLGIVAGPNAFAAALAEAPVRGGWQEWRAAARASYERSFDLAPLPGPVDMGTVTAWLRENLPSDAILTNGAGNFTVWPNKFFRFGPNQRLLAPQSGAMGYGLPAAIAAKITQPWRTVVCFAGDGDFQMNCQELATARQFGGVPIILVLNNGMYGTIRAHQERQYPGRVMGTTMTFNPDFVGLAKSYGLHAEKVEETMDFPAAFRRAAQSPTGALLELTISPEAITPRQTLSGIREAALANV